MLLLLLLLLLPPLLLLLLLPQLLSWHSRLGQKQPPPGPGGPLLLGQLPAFIASALLRGSRFRFHLFLLGLCRRYGPVAAFRLGTQRFVLLSGHAALREALIVRGDAFGYRMDTPFFRYLSRKRGLAMSDGPLWAEHRRFAARAFRQLGVGGKQAEELIEEECRRLVAALEARDGQEVEPSGLITRAIVNVISLLLFSTRADYDDGELAEYVRHLAALTHGDFVTLLITCYPWLPLRPMLAMSAGARSLVRSNDWVLDFMRRRVDAVRAGFAPPPLGEQQRPPANYVEAYLAEQRRHLAESGGVGTFDDYQLCRSAYDVYLGGTETSANALRWLLLMAALRPDLQTRCRREVVDALAGCDGGGGGGGGGGDGDGDGDSWRPVRMEDRDRLHYTRAFIEETLRYVVPLPLGVNSRVAKATEVFGYTVEPTDFVILNLFATHRDDRLFPAPEEFRPERFIDADTGHYRRLDGVVSFGIGRRACLGEQLAQRELLIFFATLVRRFRFELGGAEAASSASAAQKPGKKLADLLLGSVGLIRAPGDHKLRVTRLYE